MLTGIPNVVESAIFKEDVESSCATTTLNINKESIT